MAMRECLPMIKMCMTLPLWCTMKKLRTIVVFNKSEWEVRKYAPHCSMFEKRQETDGKQSR